MVKLILYVCINCKEEEEEKKIKINKFIESVVVLIKVFCWLVKMFEYKNVF